MKFLPWKVIKLQSPSNHNECLINIASIDGLCVFDKNIDINGAKAFERIKNEHKIINNLEIFQAIDFNRRSIKPNEYNFNPQLIDVTEKYKQYLKQADSKSNDLNIFQK